MHVIRDVLDKQIVDRNHVKIGKVDGVVARLRQGKPPRIVAVEIGSIALARRLGRVPGRWMAILATKLGGDRHANPHRVAWSKVRTIGLEIELDIDARETAILDWQVWLRDHIVRRIPGA
ncbi:hypothetical protein FJV76_13440 [Mesorhizobium sp. WSM4303]|uniref:hypothetical protein n=1 Tax=unclassified Mesorhizobium TaxID=325217 RepID=UPI00115D8CBB|nr:MULTISPECIES: hypothetical protein [unclassified Mesorhizobium]TRC98318.1 hypothetical protein FJV77_07550 [Mesorhizobium sp. WSM4306]TRD04294.1 hypothetical protein FJV76_13440 [Mesorhizobium sp. WSM4303]